MGSISYFIQRAHKVAVAMTRSGLIAPIALILLARLKAVAQPPPIRGHRLHRVSWRGVVALHGSTVITNQKEGGK